YDGPSCTVNDSVLPQHYVHRISAVIVTAKKGMDDFPVAAVCLDTKEQTVVVLAAFCCCSIDSSIWPYDHMARDVVARKGLKCAHAKSDVLRLANRGHEFQRVGWVNIARQLTFHCCHKGQRTIRLESRGGKVVIGL